MPVLVPDAVGVLYYDGFIFPATTTVTPVRRTNVTADGITYKSSEYEITATCLVSCEDTYGAVAPTSSIDTLIAYLRKRFSVVGGRFGFINWGFGTIVLNGAVSVPNTIPPAPDTGVRTAATYAVTHVPLQTGPVVHIEECRFTGYNKSVLLKVRFTFEIYDGADAACYQSDNRKVIEMTLSRSWSVSDTGFVSRVTKGTIKYWVNLNTPGGVQINDECDFISYTIVPMLPAYHREQSYDPGIDGRSLSFTITDTPIESPIPYVFPIVKLRVVHTVSSGMSEAQGFFMRWLNSFEVDCEVARGWPKWLCLNAIGQIILERMQHVFQAQPDLNGVLSFKEQALLNNQAVLTTFRITDEMTSLKFSLSLAWTCTFNLGNLVAVSKILNVPTASFLHNWPTWTYYMGAIHGVSSPGITLNTIRVPVSPSCNNGTTPSKLYDTLETPTAPPTQEVLYIHPTQGTNNPIGAPYGNYPYFKQYSRIENESNSYQNGIGYCASSPAYNPRVGTDASGGLTPPNAGVLTQSNAAYKIAPTQSYFVTYGTAIRIGAFPAIPTAVSYDGQNLTEVGRSATEVDQFTTDTGIPMYRVSWYIRYALPYEIRAGVNPYSLFNITLTERTIFVEPTA